jgi:2-isopropylmalate synthase
MNDKLIIFDTTLRDGEQSPGASMTRDEKVRIAKALERLRVNVIEAGFPVASSGDFEAVQAVARAVKESRICGLARALDKDIDRAGEALKDAVAPRIGTGCCRGQTGTPIYRRCGVFTGRRRPFGT